MIEVISKLQEAVSKAAADAEKEETVAAEAVDTVLSADSGALAEAEVEAAVRDDGAGKAGSLSILIGSQFDFLLDQFTTSIALGFSFSD